MAASKFAGQPFLVQLAVQDQLRGRWLCRAKAVACNLMTGSEDFKPTAATGTSVSVVAPCTQALGVLQVGVSGESLIRKGETPVKVSKMVPVPGVCNAIADSLARFRWEMLRELASGADVERIPCPAHFWNLF